VDFDPLWARTQQLVWRMPASNRIIYVETPISILSPLRDRSLWSKWGQWRQGLRVRKENLYLYSPPPLLPFANRWRWVNRLNQAILARALKKVAWQAGFSEPILITYLPNSADLALRLGEKLLIYDCVDEHSAFQGFNAALVRQMEIELLQKADLVLVTAQPLYDDKSPYNPNIHLLRNAADVENFRRALDPELPVASDVADLTGPVLGFIGRIKEWIDLALLGEVARKRPDWHLVLVGPVEYDADVAALQGLANVTFTGARDKEELPAYLKKFDVCLNPFRPGRLSQAVNPLKLYEYLASGKPVVSTPMPELDMLEGLVEIGAGEAGFIAAIERALADTPEKQHQRLEFVKEHSWEKRVDEMCRLIDQAGQQKEGQGDGPFVPLP